MNSRVDEKGKQIKTRLLTAQMQWIKNERDCLIKLFEKHGYNIKNPGEHRPHLETQDYIESKDMNIQERNLELYNQLSSKIDFVEAEEKELSEKEKKLNDIEIYLLDKEDELNKQEKEQKEKDEYLNTKTQIVVEAEGQLEEARQINEETKAYRNDIEQIRSDLYQELKADVNKEYKAKYQELYNVQESQDKREEELKKQKEQQDEIERQQKEKERELFQREQNVANLEAYKKSVEDKEKAVSEKEKSNEEKETDLKSREEALSQNQKDFNEAVEQYNADCATAKTFYENQQKIYEENENFMVEFRKEYREKSTKINEWEEALNFTTENNTDSWIDSEFKDCFQKKQTTQNLIQKIKQGINGIIARVKKLYDKKIRNYEKQLNGYDFIDEKGESMHSFGCAEVQKMFLDDTTAKTFRQIADDIENEGVENYAELFKKKPKILERHFEYARERARENVLTH